MALSRKESVIMLKEIEQRGSDWNMKKEGEGKEEPRLRREVPLYHIGQMIEFANLCSQWCDSLGKINSSEFMSLCLLIFSDFGFVGLPQRSYCERFSHSGERLIRLTFLCTHKIRLYQSRYICPNVNGPEKSGSHSGKVAGLSAAF
jgi:hypothetical protein